MIFGEVRIWHLDHARPSGSARLAMVQGNIPQSFKWEKEALPVTFRVYADQSRWAAAQNSNLVIWPETASGFFFQPNVAYPAGMELQAEYRRQLLDLVRSTGVPILFGAPTFKIHRGQISTFNRAYLVDGDGAIVDYYDKIQLAPVGEYLPAPALFGHFISRLAEAPSDFVPGDRLTIFKLGDARIGTLICYESAFPDLTRRFVDAGANLLVNITNDAWFGKSSAPYQLFAMATMRAIENHTPLVRVANTGISAVISPTGRVLASTELFTSKTLIENVELKQQRPTFYARHGDLFAEACVVLSIIGLLAALSRRFWIRPQASLSHSSTRRE
jgi:apolipoprotein N-acyltransferase